MPLRLDLAMARLTFRERRPRLERMSRSTTVFVALLLAFALGTSSLADCMEPPSAMPQAQMACCADGHDQCPMHSTSEGTTDCCQHNSQRQQTLATAEPASVYALAANVAHIATLPSPTTVPVVRFQPMSARSFHRLTRPPTPRSALSTVLLI
jgi:hypothetical protein